MFLVYPFLKFHLFFIYLFIGTVPLVGKTTRILSPTPSSSSSSSSSSLSSSSALSPASSFPVSTSSLSLSSGHYFEKTEMERSTSRVQNSLILWILVAFVLRQLFCSDILAVAVSRELVKIDTFEQLKHASMLDAQFKILVEENSQTFFVFNEVCQKTLPSNSYSLFFSHFYFFSFLFLFSASTTTIQIIFFFFFYFSRLFKFFLVLLISQRNSFPKFLLLFSLFFKSF